MTWKTVEISNRAAQGLKNGSCWIFANEFITKVKSLQPGEWVNFEAQGAFQGFGYVNPASLITGRVVSRVPVESRAEIVKALLEKAVAARRPLVDGGSYRAVFSESDDLPGLILDCYENPGDKKWTAVAQMTTAGMDVAKDDVVQAIDEVLRPANLVLRADSSVRNLEGVKTYVTVVSGVEAELREGTVREGDVLFAADFVGGQKTGFFLDQRDNRRHLLKLANGLKVLDLCCYSGGWGLSALKGGAAHVTFVDQSEDAINLVKRGMEMNRFDSSKARFATSDVFDFLSEDGEKFDVVVCDPPAFVKSKKNLPQAMRAYAKLNFQAMSRVKQGGLLYTCSCSFHLSEGDFGEIVLESVRKTGRIARVIHRGTQSLIDHPWILNRPESKYLKCLVLQLD